MNEMTQRSFNFAAFFSRSDPLVPSYSIPPAPATSREIRNYNYPKNAETHFYDD